MNKTFYNLNHCLAYYCAASFPRCQNDEPLPVCKHTCLELFQYCTTGFTNGLTESDCDLLPETDCTSTTTKLHSVFSVIVLYLFLFLTL
jgi:hypothetical protein